MVDDRADDDGVPQPRVPVVPRVTPNPVEGFRPPGPNDPVPYQQARARPPVPLAGPPEAVDGGSIGGGSVSGGSVSGGSVDGDAFAGGASGGRAAGPGRGRAWLLVGAGVVVGALVAGGLALALGGGDGDGDRDRQEVAASSGSSTTTRPAPDEAPAAADVDGDGEADDEADDPVPERELAATRVADLGLVPVGEGSATVVDGGFIVAGYAEDDVVLHRIGTDGTVGEAVDGSALASGGSAVFLQTLFSAGGAPYVTALEYRNQIERCGYAPVDPRTGAVGALVDVFGVAPNGCWGEPQVTEDGTVVLLSGPAIAVVDVAQGTSRLGPLGLEGDLSSEVVVTDDGYYVLTTDFRDDETSTSTLTRLDEALTVTAQAPVDHGVDAYTELVEVDGRPMVQISTEEGETTNHTIDPETLALAEVEEADGSSGSCEPDRWSPMVDGLVWTSYLGDGGSVLEGVDASCTVRARAELPDLDVDVPDEGRGDVTVVVDGGDALYVVTSVTTWDDETGIQTVHATVLDRVVLDP